MFILNLCYTYLPLNMGKLINLFVKNDLCQMTVQATASTVKTVLVCLVWETKLKPCSGIGEYPPTFDPNITLTSNYSEFNI